MNKDELLGMPAFIYPALNHDFTDLKNKIGTIESFLSKLDIVVVKFGKDGFAGFPLDSVLMLRDPAKIRIDADHDLSFLPSSDYDDIMEVAYLIRWDDDDELCSQAIKLAQKNATIMAYTTNSVKQLLELERNHFLSR